MKSSASEWIMPGVVGLIAAWLGQPLFAMILMAVPGLTAAAMPLAFIPALALAIAIAWFLARRVIPSRRNGWGCIFVGAAVLAQFLGGLGSALIGSSGGLGRDEGTALFFFVLIFGLPMTLIAAAFIIGGIVLLRRAK
jgi:hypothetical protein